jgi:hypothetical protein
MQTYTIQAITENPSAIAPVFASGGFRACKYGRHPDRSSHAHDQTVAVLSWLWSVRAQTALAALSRVCLWHRTHPARPLLGVSGRLSRSTRLSSLVCPVCRSLGRCRGGRGGAPAGSTRATRRTRERGAGLAPKLWHPQSQSASASKSK